ncbi:ribosome assembly RNA-binding protein YhbY [Magnetofaba australis]|uniref:Putative RNA-binding protein n=1 Tax=Magnetofaba australis IT-1 TaxID=1434232 RepID=A0A1Y2JZM8_9PROT|nr:ribosome assembly RNA-binding protein YhbY [Magnetofaba australis]OSM00380.1 putative RNA-binding protein [Magnetofaba australis IT-1]
MTQRKPLSPTQRKHLKGLAHALKPMVMVGKEGVTESVVTAADEVLATQELIKVRFQEFKEQRNELSEELAERANAHLVGIIGHMATLYRPHANPDKRKIRLPKA